MKNWDWGALRQRFKDLGTYRYAALVVLLGVILILVAFKSSRWMDALRFTVGWASCYFPFFLIPRTLYLYHYLIPLMIGCMGMGASLDIYLSPRYRSMACVVICALAAFGFWLWMPFVYGKYMHDKDLMVWNKAWMEGDSAFQKAREEDQKETTS